MGGRHYKNNKVEIMSNTFVSQWILQPRGTILKNQSAQKDFEVFIYYCPIKIRASISLNRKKVCTLNWNHKQIALVEAIV